MKKHQSDTKLNNLIFLFFMNVQIEVVVRNREHQSETTTTTQIFFYLVESAREDKRLKITFSSLKQLGSGQTCAGQAMKQWTKEEQNNRSRLADSCQSCQRIIVTPKSINGSNKMNSDPDTEIEVLGYKQVSNSRLEDIFYTIHVSNWDKVSFNCSLIDWYLLTITDKSRWEGETVMADRAPSQTLYSKPCHIITWLYPTYTLLQKIFFWPYVHFDNLRVCP